MREVAFVSWIVVVTLLIIAVPVVGTLLLALTVTTDLALYNVRKWRASRRLRRARTGGVVILYPRNSDRRDV